MSGHICSSGLCCEFMVRTEVLIESMMTVVATLKQQQRNVLAYLIAAHEAALRGDAAPSLLPASDQQSQTAA